MTPERFIAKWREAQLTERAAAQSHFLDLCEVLGEQKPTDADPKGEWYCFEKGATKTTGGEGWADVFKRGCFAWEYKGRRRNLDDALDQLKRYALALDNPPLLIVCDLDRFRIVTNWTNTVSWRHEFDLDGLREPANRERLKWAFEAPERLKPGLTRQTITEKAASHFAKLAQDLRLKGHDAQRVAHFVNRLVFCMFAEDVGLLPREMFKRMLDEALLDPGEWEALSGTLFATMRAGGRFGLERVAWFNGGLFDDDATLPLTKGEIERVRAAADLDWSEIDPSILGTLFERGLDPDKRSQLGAHYTDRDKIMKIIDPVIKRPLEVEWAEAKAAIEALLGKAEAAKSPAARTKHHNEAQATYRAFLDRLHRFKVLDPACGSGNFLYLALHTLKDLELRAGIEAEALGLPREFPRVGPEQLLGIEINPYAAELARVSVWIGEIQWMQRHGFAVSRNPILRPLDTIECRDALLSADRTAAPWPRSDVIVGNPPYLGAKLMKRTLGVEITEAIRYNYSGRLPGFTDLVCYWFENARTLIESGEVERVGLVATNSIRKNTNLPVMHRITATTRIYEAWSEEKWTIDGAAVDVSFVCFGQNDAQSVRLNGNLVATINPDLTSGLNLTLTQPLRENRNGAFLGIQKSGPFDVLGAVARAWMTEPANPNGHSNADVLKPYWNSDDLTDRPRDIWLIDLP
ncbi:MAG: class I SAM-dependent DNA methyltransferase, partial [Geminicoccaceae bacterium]